jgi:hypothetical protein
MAWAYSSQPVGRKKEWMNETHLRNYRQAGIRTWAASAYKGAEGAWADVPDVTERAANHLGWVEQIRKHRMAGLVATAWSRYNTFQSPCETIEACLHTLVISAAAMWDGTLPAEPVKAAEAVLGRIRGGRELRRWRACFGAASRLAKWQKDGIAWSLEEMEKAAHRNGESSRVNPAVQARYADHLRRGLKKGHAIGQEFIRAHRGLIPDLWLQLYVASRLQPLERRANAVL